MTRATAALVLLALALGTFSSLQFVWQWIFGAPTILSSWIILVGVIAGAVWPFLILNRRLRSSPIRVGWPAALLGVAATFGFYWLIQDARAWPLGGWDAWGIWNLHARFLYRGATGAWRDVFDPALAWTHNDYPLLLPALVSSFWTLVGSETHLVPTSVALVYTLLTIAIATCAASACAGHQRGWLAGLLLLASPGFLLSTSAQMADIPLSCYMLMTFACLQTAQVHPEARFPFIVFAGLSAGFAAWTKNEGALFIMVLIAAC